MNFLGFSEKLEEAMQDRADQQEQAQGPSGDE
jgi:hypothetical protein